MRWLFRTDFRSFYLLNVTQFLGALNDNLFKLLVIYLLIHLKGPGEANTVLSLAGAIFVVPFLLFSSGAGVMADRISKRTIIVYSKVMELVTMLFGLVAVIFSSEIGSYSALFLMATQSAIFGPSKYGIIPELVEPKMVSKANGSMASFTYLAIILGTVMASFITDVTDKNFILEACVCVVVSILGLIASLGIARTAPQNSTKRINPFFLYEIYQTLKASWHVPHLLSAVFGSSFFLFIGAFTQLNIIPFAIQSLHLSEVGGGYLFAATAVGIALGAFLAGQLSKDRVELGLSCIAGVFIAVLLFVLYCFSWSLTVTIITLALLGIAGGAYLIPFDSFIQINSPDSKRGQVIAASNFFSFIGVLMSSLSLYVIGEEWGFSAASGFALMGFLTLCATLILTGRVASLFFPFFVQKILKRFRKIQAADVAPPVSTLIFLESRSWWDAILLFAYVPNLRLLLPISYFSGFPWVNGWFESFRIIPSKDKGHFAFAKLLDATRESQSKNQTVCLFYRAKDRLLIEAYQMFVRMRYPVVFAHIQKESVSRRFLFIRYSQTLIRLTFSRSSHSHD